MKKLLLILGFLCVWGPSINPTSEVGYSWPREVVKRNIKTTNVLLVTYSEGTVIGGGVTITKDGKVLSAAHLFNHGAYSSIKLVTWYGESYDAKVIAINSRLDLALVEPLASAQEFPYAVVQTSDAIYVGEDIMLVGHPYELFWAATTGIISGIAFNLRYIEFMIETDALVNPGNSGGPAYNSKGEVLGIVSAKCSLSGIGIVIPVKLIHQFLRTYETQKKPGTQIKRYRIGDIK